MYIKIHIDFTVYLLYNYFIRKNLRIRLPMSNNKVYIGIDIGGTKCAVVRGVMRGGEIAVLDKVKFPTEDFSTTLSKIFSAVENMLPADGIGISSGGPLDEERGVIMSPPNLPGWDNVEITKMLEERFGIPAKLLNDANACAVAEWKWGAGKGEKNMIFLTFGTGMGAGLILDGRLYSGACGMAGEVGHIRLRKSGPVGYGKAGSFEGFCSGGGLAKWAKARAFEAKEAGRVAFSAKTDAEIEALDGASLAVLARLGDADATALFEDCGKMLGEGLSVLVDILNPSLIVIGSIYQRCEDLLAQGMRESLKKEALPISYNALKISPAALSESIGDIAALAVAACEYR